MGHQHPTLNLYSAQAKPVTELLDREGRCFSKQEYVVNKYQESAPIFVAAYSWFAAAAQDYLPKPQGAEYPYWAFRDLYSIAASTDSHILQLAVPVDEAVFFDLYDWNKILCLKYLGETNEEEAQFRQMLADYGIRRESDVILTNFYPSLKQQVQQSWHRLFRHHQRIKGGDTKGVGGVQAGLWQLKKDWIL